MNEPWDDMENELKGLRPAAPREGLERRIHHALEGQAPSVSPRGFWGSPWLKVSWAAAAGLAITIAVLKLAPSETLEPRLAIQSMSTSPPNASLPEVRAGFLPVEVDDYLLRAQDAGVIYATDHLPLRRIQLEYVTTAEWHDATDNTTVRVVVPGQNTVLVPIAVY